MFLTYIKLIHRTVKVWDMRRTYLKNAAKQPQPLHTFNVGATVTSLNVHNSLLYASCTNHSIFCFNASTFEEKPGKILNELLNLSHC